MVSRTSVHYPPPGSVLILGGRSWLTLLAVGLLPFVFAGFVLDPLAAMTFLRAACWCIVVLVRGGFIVVHLYLVPRCSCVLGCCGSFVAMGGGVTVVGCRLVGCCCCGACGRWLTGVGVGWMRFGLQLLLWVWTRRCCVFGGCCMSPEWLTGCSACRVCCRCCGLLGRWSAWEVFGAWSGCCSWLGVCHRGDLVTVGGVVVDPCAVGLVSAFAGLPRRVCVLCCWLGGWLVATAGVSLPSSWGGVWSVAGWSAGVCGVCGVAVAAFGGLVVRGCGWCGGSLVPRGVSLGLLEGVRHGSVAGSYGGA